MTHIGNVLDAYSLILASIIILFLFEISRFYQLKVGEETHHRWFLAPAMLFIVSATLYALGYDGIAPGCAGAILLIILTVMLYKIMMGAGK